MKYHIMQFISPEDAAMMDASDYYGQPNITGDAFRSWLGYCFSTCDTFSLTHTRCGMLWVGPKDQKTIEEEFLLEEQTGQRSKYRLQLQAHPAQAGFFNALAPWKAGTIRSHVWYGTRVPKKADPMEIELFKTSQGSKEVLLSYYDNFLLERPRVKHPEYPQYPQLRVRDLPEDLCFFRGDDLWLGSCSHEGFAHITALTPEDEAVMRKLGIYYPVPWEADRRNVRMKLSDHKIEL